MTSSNSHSTDSRPSSNISDSRPTTKLDAPSRSHQLERADPHSEGAIESERGLAQIERAIEPSSGQIRDAHLTPAMMLHLQRAVGNSVVLRALSSRNGEKTVTPPASADLLQREVSEEDITWANDSTSTLESLQDEVSDAVTRLNADARTAIGHLSGAQSQYDEFERKYEIAVGRFVGGVEAAQAREQEFRDNVQFLGTAMFATVAPAASAMHSAISGTVTNLGRAASIVAGPTGQVDTSGGNSPAMAARSESRINWSDLLSTTLTTFETTLTNNESLAALARECIALLRFLDGVQENRYSGDAPQSSSSGTKVTELCSSVDSVTSDLSAIDEGTVSGPTGTLSALIAERVGSVDIQQLEQDLAIRWMASLGQNDLEQINSADDYLASIGAFDAGDNRLGYDTGIYTSDIDERIIHWRAGWESRAMGLVGSSATWLGNSFAAPGENGRVFAGQIRDNRNTEWNVNIPGGAPREGGGNVHITGYTVNHRDSSGWEWSHPGDLKRQLKWEISFTGQSTDTLGGGAPAAGPIADAAP